MIYFYIYHKANINSSLSEIGTKEYIFKTDISVDVGSTWTDVTEVTPTAGYGTYLVMIQIIVPNLSSDATVTVGTGVQFCNSSTVLANSSSRRIQAVGIYTVSESYPTVPVKAYSNVAFTCTTATLNFLKLK